MDLLKKTIWGLVGVTGFCHVVPSVAGLGVPTHQYVQVMVSNEGTCSVNTSGGGTVINTYLPAQAGATAEIGVLHVTCTVDGKTYAAISSNAAGPWASTATLIGTSLSSVKAEIGKRTRSDTISGPTVVLSTGTVTEMVGSADGEFDLRLTYSGMSSDSWTVYVLAGRWAD